MPVCVIVCQCRRERVYVCVSECVYALTAMRALVSVFACARSCVRARSCVTSVTCARACFYVYVCFSMCCIKTERERVSE